LSNIDIIFINFIDFSFLLAYNFYEKSLKENAMSKTNFNVRKANGSIEIFKPEKLIVSLIRAGATQEEAQKITGEIIPKIQDTIETRKIYSIAHSLLRKYNRKSSMKYSLKKAMLKLGPAGYAFEKYFADIMEVYGYKTQTDIVVKGTCIKHEVDVLAFKGNQAITVECKYHSTAGRASDAKVAMYIHSRFRDLEEAVKKTYNVDNYEGWLVTNTRFTIDAINYAKCNNMKTIGWRYPENAGLESMVEQKRLYPVTIISGIKANLSNKLISKGYLLVKDVAYSDEDVLKNVLRLTSSQAKKLKQQALDLCNGKELQQ
jgi:hypothetical protein